MIFHDSNMQPELFFEDSTLIGAYAQALTAEFPSSDHMDLDWPSPDPYGISVSAVCLILLHCAITPLT
jgi:hypothetical protein